MLKFPINEYFSLLSYTHNRRPVRLTAVIAVDLMSVLVDLGLFCDLVDHEVGNLEVDEDAHQVDGNNCRQPNGSTIVGI